MLCASGLPLRRAAQPGRIRSDGDVPRCADVVGAETALEYGLVSQVVAADDLIEAATKLAERVAQQPPHSLRLTKSLLRQGQTNDLGTVLELSAAAQF